MAMVPTPVSRVNVPGIGLIVTGVLGVLTGLGWMALLAIGGVAALGDPDAAAALGGIGVLMGAGVVGLLISAFVAYAGLKMRQLRGWGIAMAGAVLAVLPCGPCCIVGLPFGIWAVMVLIDEEVKQAFDGGSGPPGPDLGGYGATPPPHSPPPGPPPAASPPRTTAPTDPDVTETLHFPPGEPPAGSRPT